MTTRRRTLRRHGRRDGLGPARSLARTGPRTLARTGLRETTMMRPREEPRVMLPREEQGPPRNARGRSITKRCGRRTAATAGFSGRRRRHRWTIGIAIAAADVPAVRSGWDAVDVAGRPVVEGIQLSAERAGHILDGDADGPGGGHRHGTGRAGKTEFPAHWDDGKVIVIVLDVARRPVSRQYARSGTAGRWHAVRVRTLRSWWS